MKLNKFILLVVLISAEILHAQTDYRPGYIIKNSGDTVFGKIDYRGDILMCSICRFKHEDNNTSVYTPADIFAYRFLGSKYFVSKEINQKKVFLEYLIKGKVNIYYMRDDIGDHYYLDKDDVRLTELTYEEGIKLVDGKQVFYQSKQHIRLLSFYLQDAPELKSRIQSIEKPEHEILIKLAEDYHNAVCDGEKCIIYEKKQPFIKINLEIVSGVVNFENIDDLNDKFYFQNGVILNFWVPRSNEKIFLRTGILTSPILYTTGEKIWYLKVPLHIGYMAPNTFRIRPSFSIGLIKSSYSAGIDVKINKCINIGIQSWVNFYSENIPMIPSKLFSYSILGDLYFEL